MSIMAVKSASLTICIAMIVMVFGSVLARAEIIPDRRKEQFPTEPAHLIVPLPYSLAGVGEGIFWLANLSNVFETTADTTFIYASGDVEGYIASLAEVPLIPQTLLLEGWAADISKAAINNYEKRGMDSIGKDEFTIVELSSIRWRTASLTLTFFERRLDFIYNWAKEGQEMEALLDNEGNLIVRLDEPFVSESESSFYGVRFDFTDDFQDPRLGVRVHLQNSSRPATDPNEAEFDVASYNASFYIPVGGISTLVLNYFQSDARVKRQGITDRTAIETELGIVCPGGDAACAKALTEQIDNIVARRTNGTASSLGGFNRMRSYPLDRFQGAHTAFYGAEFRWNLTEEVTPFDWFIWKDTRTGVQVALFYETGTVAETSGKLWNQSRDSYGVGMRLVTASGSVYRGEVASGDEGSEITVIFSYPWDINST